MNTIQIITKKIKYFQISNQYNLVKLQLLNTSMQSTMHMAILVASAIQLNMRTMELAVILTTALLILLPQIVTFIRSFQHQYQINNTNYSQLYFQDHKEQEDLIQSSHITTGLLLKIQEGQTAHCDLAIIKTSHSESKFKTNICSGNESAIKCSPDELSKTSLNKISGQAVWTGDSQLLKIDSMKSRVEIKSENILNTGETLVGTAWVVGVVLNVACQKNFCLLYSTKSFLEHSQFQSFWSATSAGLIILSGLGLAELNADVVRRSCEFASQFMIFFQLYQQSSYFIIQNNITDILDIAAAVDLSQINQLIVNFKTMLDFQNSEVSGLVLGNKIISTTCCNVEATVRKHGLWDKLIEQIKGLVVINFEELQAYNSNSKNARVEIISIANFLKNINIEYSFNSEKNTMQLQVQHKTYEMEKVFSDGEVTGQIERDNSTQISEIQFLIFNVDKTKAQEILDIAENDDGLQTINNLDGLAGEDPFLFLRSQVELQNQELIKHQVMTKHKLIGGLNICKIIQKLELQIDFLGSVLLTSTMDNLLHEEINHICMKEDKRMVLLVDSTNPKMDIHVKGKEPTEIFKELKNVILNPGADIECIQIMAHSQSLILKSNSLQSKLEIALLNGCSIAIIKQQNEDWTGIQHQMQRNGITEQSLLLTNDYKDFEHVYMFKLTASNQFKSDLVDISLNGSTSFQNFGFTPLKLAELFFISQGWYVQADLRLQSLVVLILIMLPKFLFQNHATDKVNMNQVYAKALLFQVGYVFSEPETKCQDMQFSMLVYLYYEGCRNEQFVFFCLVYQSSCLTIQGFFFSLKQFAALLSIIFVIDRFKDNYSDLIDQKKQSVNYKNMKLTHQDSNENHNVNLSLMSYNKWLADGDKQADTTQERRLILEWHRLASLPFILLAIQDFYQLLIVFQVADLVLLFSLLMKKTNINVIMMSTAYLFFRSFNKTDPALGLFSLLALNFSQFTFGTKSYQEALLVLSSVPMIQDSVKSHWNVEISILTIMSLLVINISNWLWTSSTDTNHQRLGAAIEQRQDIEKLIRTKLDQILPKFVDNTSLYSSGDLRQHQTYENVSIAFISLSNFEDIFNELGQKTFFYLNQLFSRIDSISSQYDCQKVETVNSYQVLAAITKNEDKQLRSLKVAKLIDACMEILSLSITTENKNYDCNFKIGIHHGTLTAAVTGCIKAQFSFIGDVMNTSSRHCAKSQEGRILLSDTVFKIVKEFNKQSFEKHAFEAKGKGSLTGYFVNPAYVTSSSNVKLDFQTPEKLGRSYSLRNSFLSDRSASNEDSPIKQSHRISLRNSFRANSNVEGESLDNSNKKSKFVRSSSITESDEDKLSLASKLKRSTMCGLHLSATDSELIDQIIETKTSLLMAYPLRLLGINDDNDLLHVKMDSLLLSATLESRIHYSFLVMRALLWFWLAVQENQQADFERGILLPLLEVGCVQLSLVRFSFVKSIEAESNPQAKSALIVQFLRWMWVLAVLHSVFQARTCVSAVSQHPWTALLLLLTNVYSYQLCALPLTLAVCKLVEVALFLALTWAEGQAGSATSMSIILIALMAHGFFIVLMHTLNMDAALEWHLQALKCEQFKAKQKSLVEHSMPASALQRLENKDQVFDRLTGIPILQGDIKGFTKLCSDFMPEEIYTFIKEIYSKFDVDCQRFGCQKVHTIGDCQVAISNDFYPTRAEQEMKCLRLVVFAITMGQVLLNVRTKQKLEISMRVGLHWGELLGTVVGDDCLRQDIFGNDSTIANNAESNGEADRIVVTTAFKDRLLQELKEYNYDQFNNNQLFTYHKSFEFQDHEQKLQSLKEDQYKVLLEIFPNTEIQAIFNDYYDRELSKLGYM